MKSPMLKITDLEYSYPGTTKLILKKFSQELEQGQVLGIIGRNGVGKSTFMRLLAGIHQPLSGKIELNGINSQDVKNRKDYILNYFYISHDKTLLEDYTIGAYFELYSTLYPNYSETIEKNLMKRFNLENDEKISNLSTGNKIKVHIVFALASQVNVILADEVTAVLDPENREDFFDLVREFKDQKRSFIIATNIVEDLRNYVDKVFFVDHGEVRSVLPEDVLTVFKKKAA